MVTPKLDLLAFAMPADADSTPADAAAASPAGAFHFKLPTFSTVDAAIWFRRAEVQFRLKKVTSSRTQADHVLAAIPDTLFPQMSTWLDSKGDDAVEYQDLKAFLLKRFSPSAEKRVQMLLDLSKQALGDQRPSEALTEMRSLCRLPPDAAGTTQTIDVLLALWLLRLPNPVRAAITDFISFNDDALAARADSLLDAHNATSHSPVHAATPPASPADDVLPQHPPDESIAASSPVQRVPAPTRGTCRCRLNSHCCYCFLSCRSLPLQTSDVPTTPLAASLIAAITNFDFLDAHHATGRPPTTAAATPAPPDDDLPDVSLDDTIAASLPSQR